MAYRFRREGQRHKNRVHVHLSGMRPWIDQLAWKSNKFHYENNMITRAEKSLFTDVSKIENMQLKKDASLNLHIKTRYFPTALPNIVPARRSSNPFCRTSQNFTGWYLAEKHQRIPDPMPFRTRVPVGGTDNSIPDIPKYK